MPATSTKRWGIRAARVQAPEEVDRLYDIGLRTGDSGAGAETLHEDPRLLGEVYVGAYLKYVPELAFVLEDAQGSPAGYVLGARDTVAFEQLLEERWWPSLRAKYPLNSFPAGSHDEKMVRRMHTPKHTDPAVIRDFPAHLHINILRAAQGGGNGRRLMETLFSALRDVGVGGVHLSVSPKNLRAIGFYQHLGFMNLEGNLWALPL